MKFEEVLWGLFGISIIIMGFPFAIGFAAGHGARWVAVDKLGMNYWIGIAIGWIVGLYATYLAFGLYPANWVGSGDGAGCVSNRYCE